MIYESKVKVVEGMEFKVVPFPAIEALRLKADLLKIIGPSLGMALGSIGSMSDVMKAQINGPGISTAIKMLFEQLDADAFIALVRRILDSTSVQIKAGDKVVFYNFQEQGKFDTQFNDVFQGKLLSLYPVMLFVLEVNFPDFFVKARDFGSRLPTHISNVADNTGTDNLKK